MNLWLATQALIGNISTDIAQTEWKTYLNPVYKFSFDYPHSNISAVMETPNYDVIVGDSDTSESLFRLEIIPKNETYDLTSIVEADKERTLSYKSLKYSLFQDVEPVN